MVVQRNAAFAEESAEVEVLLASLSKTKDLTKKITSSMSRLDDSGRLVREAIGPIYNNTQQLQITHRNIDRVNEAIEKLVRQPIDARGREEGIIAAGPRQAGLPQYLGALRRVDKALTELNATNIRTNQQAISDFYSLLSTGVNQLHDLFRKMLNEETEPVEPLHYITKQLQFPMISQDQAAALSQIAAAIGSAHAHAARLGKGGEDAAVQIYTEIRGDHLQSSLQNLATASISTSKRKENDSTIYRQGASGIGAYAQGLEGMFNAEFENISHIFRFDPPSVARVFSLTCAKALSTFTRTLSELNTFIKSHLLSDCFLAYEILDLVNPMMFRLESRTRQLRPQLSDALRPIRETARSSLSDLVAMTKSAAETVPTLPSDGNTIPLVSATSTRLQVLSTFDASISPLLSSLGEGGWRQPTTSNSHLRSTSNLNLELTPSTENPTLLSRYLLDLITSLLDPLTNRSQALHRTKPLQGIFLLNTISILTRSITTHADLNRYLGITPHNSLLDSRRKAASSIYLSAWRDPASHLLDTITTSTPGTRTSGSQPRPMSGQPIDSTAIIKSLNSKDKDKIKEKFRNFNTSFDELIARHKSLYMEKEVKGMLSREITQMIEPLYARFWDRYHEVDKGKGKVVKYTKGELATLLGSL